jgi:WXG100 family type VII secretion target
MAEIYVNTSAKIQEVITSLTNYNNEFKNKTSEINQEHMTLTSKWQGDASDVFTERFQRQYPSFENFSQAVEEYIKALEVILQEYEAAEEANKAIAQD